MKKRAAHPKPKIIYNIVSRCRRNGVLCDRDFLFSLPIPSHCPILGTPISFESGKGFRAFENIASYDRLDNSKGYIPGNVRIISHKANLAKSNMTIWQVENLLSYMRKGS